MVGEARTEAVLSRSGRLARDALLALLVIQGGWLIALAFQEERFGIQATESTLTIRDFASHWNYARRVFTGAVDYSVASHLNAARSLAEAPVEHALPFGYSPTMIVLLFPLFLCSAFMAYAIWTIFSVLVAVALVRRDRSWDIAGALLMISPLAFSCLALGQTAVLSAACFAVLARACQRRDGLKAKGVASAALWALTAKPPLAIVGAAGLWLSGSRRDVFVSVAAAGGTIALMLPFLGWDSLGNYVEMIAHYDRQSASPVYAWSLAPSHMTNVRSILSVDIGVGDRLASQCSSVLFFAGLGGIALWGSRGADRGPACLGLALLVYLAFFPHVTATENLLLISILPVLAMGRDRSSALKAYWLAPAVGFISPSIGPFAGIRPATALATLMIFFLLARQLLIADRDLSGRGITRPMNPPRMALS